jgi:hypothetical protein
MSIRTSAPLGESQKKASAPADGPPEKNSIGTSC